MEKKQFGVAVKAVIKKKNKYLVIEKSDKEKIDTVPETVDIPGGRMEFSEKIEDALIREVKEETNLDIKVLFPINAWTFKTSKNFQLVGITFLSEWKKGELKLSNEHTKGSWLTFKEIKNKKFPSWFLKEFEMAEYHKNKII